MSKWTNQTAYPALAAASVAADDLMPIADVSQDDGEQQRTITFEDVAEAVKLYMPHDFTLGFTGVPDAAAFDWLLASRAATIASSDPGEAFPLVNPADGDWVATLQKNGVSVGTVTISTAGAVSWSVASDVTLAAGDRIGLLAPDPADSALSDVQVAVRAVLT